METDTQVSLYIPYSPEPEPSENTHITAYRAAWSRCLAHLKAEIQSLYAPVVDAIVQRMSTVHTDVLPGILHHELPVIAVHNVSGLFVDTLLDSLPTQVAVSHLYPSDARNLANGMKALVSSFLGSTKHATYDIAALNTLYEPQDPLLVVLHDFEQFEPTVMQDVLYICGTRIPSIHLTFLALLSSLPTPTSFIFNTYSRATLTRLCVHSFSVPNGLSVLDRLLLKTFFNPSFEPDIMLGPAAFEGLIDCYTRHNSSIDALLTSIQLAYFKHFLTEPLSNLYHAPDSLQRASCDLLGSRLPRTPAQALPAALQTHKKRFRAAFRSLRLGLTLFHTAIIFLTSKGYKPFSTNHQHITANIIISVLRNNTFSKLKNLTVYTRKLSPHLLLPNFLEEVLGVYSALPPEYGYDEDREHVCSLLTSFEENGDALDPESISLWFEGKLSRMLKPLERSTELWDIWYTGCSVLPSELLNPCPRASTISALLRPYSFTLPFPDSANLSSDYQTHGPTEQEQEPDIHTLPDTSILFTRYLDSGKLINIYDWYESFKVILDGQRAATAEASAKSQTKAQAKTKNKSKLNSKNKKAKKVEGEEDCGLIEDQAEGEWLQEVQARFLRAVHELDYLGFVKHTGRRVEHVSRVVFDVGDNLEDVGEL